MRIRLMIASAATATLLAGAALAQNAPAGDTAVNPPSANQLPPGAASDNSTAPAAIAPTQGPSSASAPSVNAPSSDAASVAPAAGAPAERAPAASAGTDLISNGPVPDTPANRAKYGQPLSHAGRATKPAGN
jgi:hypothetical protein